MMKSDVTVIENAFVDLVGQPNMDKASVDVIVDKGTITLAGTVEYHSKKRAAEKSFL
uniref:hypothetical protein n=1 Tax=Nonlabens sp. Ci31 TaxID=2608253 RepID=UPI001475355D|nr:hypothetical protein [Nonlabens sp. Ci31]